jgi:hypothetical protein
MRMGHIGRKGMLHSIRIAARVTACAAVFCFVTHRASAATPFLNVDFNSDNGRTDYSPTESGPPAFVPFDVPFGTGAVSLSRSFATDTRFTSGTTTVTLSGSTGNLSSRDRTNSGGDGGAFTFGDLYRDFAVADNDNETMTIALSGLRPHTPYDFSFYAYDADVRVQAHANSTAFTNVTGGTQPGPIQGIVRYGGQALNSNAQHSITLRGVSNASGSATFTEQSAASSYQLAPILNGLQITPVKATAPQVPRIFNTGVDSSGALLPLGSVDPHYTLASSAEPDNPGPSAYTANLANGAWIPDGPTSRWITPLPTNKRMGVGDYVYRTALDLTGLNPALVQLSGKWTTDNQGTAIRLNGSNTGLPQTPAEGFGTFHNFAITSGFVSGVNTLDFVVHNDSGDGISMNPTGLRAEFHLASQVVPGTPSVNPGAGTLPPPGQALTGRLRHWDGSAWSAPLTSTSQLDPAEKQKPTVVITHGWHGSVTDPAFTQKAQSLGNSYDIFTWDWHGEANPYNYATPLDEINDRGLTGAALATANGSWEGIRLSRDLTALGLDPSQMQLIGHSAGAAVIGTAAKNLEQSTGKEVQRLTLLDAPNLQLKEVPQSVIEPIIQAVVNPLKVDPLFYIKWRTSSVNALQYVDNHSVEQVEVYYSSARGSLGFGTALPNPTADGNIWNGDVYAASDFDQLKQGGEHTRMPSWYAALNPNLPSQTHGNYTERSVNSGTFDPVVQEIFRNETTPMTTLDFNDGSVWSGQHAVPTLQPDGHYSMRLFENSDGYLFKTIEIPDDAYYMTFDFKIENAGDGDYLSTSFESSLLGLLDLSTAGTDFTTTDPMFVGNLDGQTGMLLFALNSQGSVNASLLLDNITFYSVPEPSSITILLFCSAWFLRRTRRYAAHCSLGIESYGPRF